MVTKKQVVVYEEETQRVIGEVELEIHMIIQKDLSFKLEVPNQQIEIEYEELAQSCNIENIKVSISASHRFDCEEEITFKPQGLYLKEKEGTNFKMASGYLWVEI